MKVKHHKKIDKNIMKHVDILDQIKIVVTQPMPGNFAVHFEPYDRKKHVVIDEKAKETMDAKITEKAKALSARDPKTKMFIEEFAGRLLSELFRVELAVLEDVPETPTDPYAEIKKKYRFIH